MKYLLILLLTLSFQIVNAQTAGDYYEQAKSDGGKKDYKAALKAINKALVLDSMNPNYYISKANYLVELKEYQEVFNTINKGILLNPKTDFLYLNRGDFLMSADYPDKAIEDFTKAMELAPNDTSKNHALVNRAAAKSSKRDFEGAYDDLHQAYLFDSSNITILNNLGALCDDLGKGEEGINYLLIVIKIDSTMEGSYVNIGFNYQHAGNYQKAAPYFDKALQINPKSGIGYCNRSYNKLMLNDISGALKDIEMSLKLYDENSYAYRTRALIYLKQNKKDKACADLQTASEKGFKQNYGDEVTKLIRDNCLH